MSDSLGGCVGHAIRKWPLTILCCWYPNSNQWLEIGCDDVALLYLVTVNLSQQKNFRAKYRNWCTEARSGVGARPGFIVIAEVDRSWIFMLAQYEDQAAVTSGNQDGLWLSSAFALKALRVNAGEISRRLLSLGLEQDFQSWKNFTGY